MPSQFTYKATSFSSQNWSKNTPVFHSASSGKEKDAETGYHYFGARYYNSDLSLWLSVDPMSDNNPSLSPYSYCSWNPMRLIDPDGRDDWELNKNGELVWMKKSKNETIKMGNRSIFSDNPIMGSGEEGTIVNLNGIEMSFGDQQSQAEMYFEFFADNLDYEFSLLGYEEDKKTKFEVWTSLDKNGDHNGSKRALDLSSGGKLIKHVHNHTNNIAEPSSKKNHTGIGNDMDFRAAVVEGSPRCDFYIYTKDNGGTYSKYEKNGFWLNSLSRFEKKSRYARVRLNSPLN